MSQALFDDDTLVQKHKHILTQLQWGHTLGRPRHLIQATPCPMHHSVIDSLGRPENTPHYFYVDDGIYCEVYQKHRIHWAAAASIKAIFCLLREPNPSKRQDPVSWDKLLDMVVDFANTLLGWFINTRTMMVSTPDHFLSEVLCTLTHWHSKRKSFTLKEIESLVGKLNQVALSAPWLTHLLSHLYTSITAALHHTGAHLLHSSSAF